MIYDIRHITTYRYDSQASSAALALRLLPRDDVGQRVLETQVTVSPLPAEQNQDSDFFGNNLTFVRIDRPHTDLRVEAVSRVKVERDSPLAPALTPSWETIRAAAASASSLSRTCPAHFLYPSRLVSLHAPAMKYAGKSFARGRPVLEATIDLMGRIKRDFAYDQKATAVSTTVPEAFERRRGVCQDFAHVMISGMRGLGLPACYVSGYIRTTPPEGSPRLEGADASHAWVGVWCGPEFGWLGLDPTNDLVVADDHIVLAFGRDYADVSPTSGVFVGSGHHDLTVGVDVRPHVD
ncbi:MAG: transglutaminase family protein [Beijerinckiaceae bacterium]|nr:transglutaminase family protein [Beijerinckiaceae bacterium]